MSASSESLLYEQIRTASDEIITSLSSGFKFTDGYFPIPVLIATCVLFYSILVYGFVKYLTKNIQVEVSTKKLDVPEPVAKVERLFVYPIKSCGFIEAKEWKVNKAGFQFDREWMIIQTNRTNKVQKDEFHNAPAGVEYHPMLTLRELPKMALIQPSFVEDKHNKSNKLLKVSVPKGAAAADEKISVTLDESALPSKNTVYKSLVWRCVCEGVDQGDKVSELITDFIKRTLNESHPLNTKDLELRLIRMEEGKVDLRKLTDCVKYDEIFADNFSAKPEVPESYLKEKGVKTTDSLVSKFSDWSAFSLLSLQSLNYLEKAFADAKDKKVKEFSGDNGNDRNNSDAGGKSPKSPKLTSSTERFIPQRFRPNIFVDCEAKEVAKEIDTVCSPKRRGNKRIYNHKHKKTLKADSPFQEEYWSELSIGINSENRLIDFHFLKKVGRCIVTTVSPLTGEKDSKQPLEPLRTIKKLRPGDYPFIKEDHPQYDGVKNAFFCVNLMHVFKEDKNNDLYINDDNSTTSNNVIKVGDIVRVERFRQNE